MRRVSTCQSVSVGALLSKWYMTILVLFTVVYGTFWCILNVWATLETKLHMDSSFSYARKIHVCLLLSSVRPTFNLNNVIVFIFSQSYWCGDLKTCLMSLFMELFKIFFFFLLFKWMVILIYCGHSEHVFPQIWFLSNISWFNKTIYIKKTQMQD